MPTELQSLKKQAAELIKLKRQADAKQSVAERTARRDHSGTGSRSDRYQRWAASVERTLNERIAHVISLLGMGKFDNVKQLADAMGMTVPQVGWALRHAGDRGLLPGPLCRRLMGHT